MLPLDTPDSDVPKPDFRHVHTWLFDLDNTLYPADSNLFAQIDERMTDYITRHLAMSAEEAWRLQHSYYREYGSTLSGLIRLNGVDPEAFLAYVHDIDLSAITPDETLITAIDRLPGRRFVFTNGCRHHAKRVLDRLGLAEAVDKIWDIRALGFTPKPQTEAYHRVVTAGDFDPKGAAMFEDMARNLMPAYAMGMTTVWINNGSQWSQQGPEYPLIARRHIHHEIDDLAEFLHAIRI
ncbi:MAG: pyrimidine 5'-nucleotidase [Alphaproteobacteria bacterium]|nr:pyrimidine 5'-nucleotidase [Alphaproteobacteria bacterium]MDE2111295.1 pyrimidine 5'-nucleotidase [Alphaproteobacteria bacterium]MDE2495871.1 pyrimidine 5'-nucleotidase [Alphaproteobacteria bacterium]